MAKGDVWPPLVRFVGTIVGRLTARDRGSLMVGVLADRRALIDVVRTRLGQP